MRPGFIIFILFFNTVAAYKSAATVYLTVPQALEQFFPKPLVVTTERFFLPADQGGLITRYVAKAGDRVIHYAYIDTHTVRTENETLWIMVSPQGAVEQITILSFNEPRDYLPSELWLKQFNNRQLSPELSLKGNIHGITGASLSARGATEAVRRVLTKHAAITSLKKP